MIPRPVRFAIVGVAVALLYLCLYTGLVGLGLTRLSANAAAFLIAVTTQYLGQTLFTFRAPLALPIQMARFVATVTCGMVVSALVTSALGPALGWPEWMSALAVTLILPIQNYILLTVWVYRTNEPMEGT